MDTLSRGTYTFGLTSTKSGQTLVLFRDRQVPQVRLALRELRDQKLLDLQVQLERLDLKEDPQGRLDQKEQQDLSEQQAPREMLDLQDLQGQIAQSLGPQDLTELRDLQDRQDRRDLREQQATMLLPLTILVKLLMLQASQVRATP